MPSYDRHWLIPVADELGLDYFGDATHEIEYTDASFRDEMHAAGMRVLAGAGASASD